jgi:Protein of unknown function (DUF3047)
MAGTLVDLWVAGKLAARSIGRRLRSQIEPAPDLAQFTASMETLLAQAPSGTVKHVSWLNLPADQPPWVESDTQVQAGEEISYFVAGRAYVNRFLDIYVNPSLQLWCKNGPSGEIFRGPRDSFSFRADSTGNLMFGSYFPNDWADLQGTRKQSDDIYRQMSGELKILVIRWHGTAADGLRSLQQIGDPDLRLASELERIEQGDTTPYGWKYLWHLGPAEIYQTGTHADGETCIHCRTHADVGILQKDVDLPLQPETEISWRWCVEQLPSTLREDTVPSHDYLSIAVEFDNGRDITYYWSAGLPEGTGYDCPLPNWQGIEYHVVVRSGPKGLGDWHDERRNLYEDYQRYMGEPPARVVKVWLIANSIFQRQPGRCDYANIVLHNRSESLRLL